MRVVLQRVSEANVVVDNQCVGSIKKGLLLLVGVTHEDTQEDIDYLARKISHLRIFEDSSGKMNENIQAIQGEILSISQFTLYGQTKRGNRPSFTQAAAPELAIRLYEQFNECLRSYQLPVQTGIFGADMKVHLVNDGPVTLMLDSKAT